MTISKLAFVTTSVLLTSCLVMSAVAPASAAESGGKPEKSDVVVTYAQPSGAFTPIWVAYEAGLFKKYGLNANLQLLTPQVSAQAVVSEEADFYTDGPDLINARLRGGQVKYFAGTIQQLVFEIWGAKEIKTIQDLKGKTVAASTPRAALDTATREALRKTAWFRTKTCRFSTFRQCRQFSVRSSAARPPRARYRRRTRSRRKNRASIFCSTSVSSIFPPSKSPTVRRYDGEIS